MKVHASNPISRPSNTSKAASVNNSNSSVKFGSFMEAAYLSGVAAVDLMGHTVNKIAQVGQYTPTQKSSTSYHSDSTQTAKRLNVLA